jgi:hypothetical protein
LSKPEPLRTSQNLSSTPQTISPSHAQNKRKLLALADLSLSLAEAID